MKRKMFTLILAFLFAITAFPASVMAALPWENLLYQPGLKAGDLINAGANSASGTYNYDTDYAQFDFVNKKIYFDNDLKTVQFDYFIYGDGFEFAAPPVITYDNGTVIIGEIDKYADGEHSTVTLDTSIEEAVHAELFQAYTAVCGHSDETYIFSFAEYSYFGDANSPDSTGGTNYDYMSYTTSRYSPTRVATKEGSVLDVIEIIESYPFGDNNAFYDAKAKIWPIPAANSTLDEAPAAESPSSWALEQVNAAIELGFVPQTLQSKYTQATIRAEFCALAVAVYENIEGEITERSTFTDTTDVNVEKAAAIGVVDGVGNNLFDPYAKLTREQAAVMLSRLAEAVGHPLKETNSAWDENGGSISFWAIPAVGQMQQAGIMTGYGNGVFDAQGPYTREQSIITIMRLYDIVK